MTATVERPVQLEEHIEAPLTLEEPPPRVLGWLDQIGLWGNLGMSILGPVTAIYILQPYQLAAMSYVGAAIAIFAGTVLGTLLVAAAAVPGAQTGAPSMVLLRGLFGRRLSYVPTLLNVAQLIGWGVFEIVVIASAAGQLLPWRAHRWPYVLIAGVLTTGMALRPLGVLVLRELDQSFADTYSTVVSIQNLRPLADRRVLALVIGALATGLALVLDISNYFDFLYLLGSVFVPLFAVFVVDYFVLRSGRLWQTGPGARPR